MAPGGRSTATKRSSSSSSKNKSSSSSSSAVDTAALSVMAMDLGFARSNQRSTNPNVPAHLTSMPHENPFHQRARNPHVSRDLEKYFAEQMQYKNQRLLTQPPPRTVQSEKGKYVDMMKDEYPTHPGQVYAVMSFVVPEHAAQRREEFLFEQFIKHTQSDLTYKLMGTFGDFMAQKYGIDAKVIETDMKEFMESYREEILGVDVSAKFTLFCKEYHDELLAKYESINGRETTMRGINVLGVVGTVEEAEQLRDDTLLLKKDHLPIVFGEVGKWLCFNPSGLLDRKYMEPELNELMAGHEKKQARKKEAFTKRKNETVLKAARENEANAKKFGTKTTMLVDAEGHTVNTTRDDGGVTNLLAALDGNGLDIMTRDDDPVSLEEMKQRDSAKGVQAFHRPIDLETGDAAAYRDERREELIRQFAKDEKNDADRPPEEEEDEEEFVTKSAE